MALNKKVFHHNNFFLLIRALDSFVFPRLDSTHEMSCHITALCRRKKNWMIFIQKSMYIWWKNDEGKEKKRILEGQEIMNLEFFHIHWWKFAVKHLMIEEKKMNGNIRWEISKIEKNFMRVLKDYEDLLNLLKRGSYGLIWMAIEFN